MLVVVYDFSFVIYQEKKGFAFVVDKMGCFAEMPSPYFFVPPPPPESFRGVPYPHVVPPVVYYPPPQDPQLLSKLVKQIDYYFRYFQLLLACF